MMSGTRAASRLARMNSTVSSAKLTNVTSAKCEWSRYRCLSTARTKDTTDTMNATTTAVPPIPYEVLSWGTINKGSIPVKSALEEGKRGADGGGGGGAAANLLNRGGAIVDHPQIIDLGEAFGIDNKSVTVQSMHCGPTGTAVIFSDNTCCTFGQNESGQLGHGHNNAVLTPTFITPPDSTPLHSNEISQIALGANFSAIIDTHGDLYTCGHNGSTMQTGVGCLGHGYFQQEYLYTPTIVQSLVKDACYASQVAVGNFHMTVLTTEGEVLTCGAGAYGRCGNLDPVDQLFLEPVEMLAAEKDIVQISGGKDFTLALTGGDGIIFAWGRNHRGQCGTGSGLGVDMYAMEPMPMPIEGPLEGRKVVKIATGQSHAAAITDKGELFTWGMGQTFQPELITALGHTKVVDVACGHDYTIAVGQDGQTYSFGKGKTGVLGLASETSAPQPKVVEGLSGNEVVKISAGWTHAAVLVVPKTSP